MKNTANQYCALFREKWNEVYRLILSQKGFTVRPDQQFGQVQDFAIRKEGVYHMIKNVSYAQKKSSSWVNIFAQSKCINLPYSPAQFNFNKSPLNQTVAYVDFNTMSLILNENKSPEIPTSTDEYLTPHYIKKSKNQFCNGHSIFIPFVKQNHPQILTPIMLETVFRLKQILPSYVFGYNSQGGGSTVNHFHSQLIEKSSLITTDKFHFETIPGQLLSTVYITPDGSTNPIALRIYTFQFIGALFFRINIQGYSISDRAVVRQMAKVVYTIVEMAFKYKIPHNFNIPDTHNFYFILRNFANERVRYGWLEYCGVHKAKNNVEYTLRQDQIAAIYNSVALKFQDFV